MVPSKPLFSQTTINFLLELILVAEKIDPVLLHRGEFIQDWLKIDWSDRESVLPIVGLVERAYNLIPQGQQSIHRDVGAALGVDGYRMRDGKLRRVVG